MALNRALTWTLLAMAATTVMKLGGNWALAHLLLPYDFGLAAIVFAIIFGIEMMTDGGAVFSLIRSKRTDDAWLDTVWSFQIARSALIALIACAIAWPIGSFYNERKITYMLLFVALLPICTATISTTANMALRDLNLKRYSAMEISALALSYISSLFVAWYFQSAWALVIGGVVNAAMLLVFSFTMFPHRPHKFRFEPEALREVLGFGLWLTLTSAIAFVIAQGDKFIISKALSISALGIYSIAISWAMALAEVAGRIIMRIFVPVFSSMFREDGNADRIAKVRMNVLIAGIIPFASVAGVGEHIINFLYPERLAEAGPVLRVLLIGVWFQTLDNLYYHQFLAEGKSDRRFYAQIISLIGLVIALYLAWEHLTIWYLSAIFAAGIALRSFVMNIMANWGRWSRSVPDIVLSIVFLLMVAAFTWIANWLEAFGGDFMVMMIVIGCAALPSLGIALHALKQSNRIFAPAI